MYIFDACIKPSTPGHNNNFLNKKLEVITERHTRDLMIRCVRSPASSLSTSFLIFYPLREKLQYCNIIVYFVVCITVWLFLQCCNLEKNTINLIYFSVIFHSRLGKSKESRKSIDNKSRKDKLEVILSA